MWNEDDDWGQPRRPRNNRWFGLLAGAIALYGLGVATGSLWLGPRPQIALPQGGKGQNSVPENSTPETNPPATQQSTLPPELSGNIITKIYEEARPSIFTITAVTPKSKQSSAQEDIGTGFLIDTHGDIATNNHVVNGLHTVAVTGENRTYQGTVIGADPLDDLAIVHINAPANLRPLSLGSSKALLPGQLVIAIGNPFQLTASVSAGIVSGLNRSMPTASGRMMSGLLQTDAALNPGNSGGPLLNANGQVVGINTAIESPVQGSVGIGFAIPIERLIQLEPKLLRGVSVQHPWLGIVAIDIDPGVQEQMNLPVSSGVLVIATAPGGPAAVAKIHGDSAGQTNPKGDGDIITGVNGHAVATVADLTAAISQYPVGTVVHLDVIRHGKHLTIAVKLGSWSQKK